MSHVTESVTSPENVCCSALSTYISLAMPGQEGALIDRSVAPSCSPVTSKMENSEH